MGDLLSKNLVILPATLLLFLSEWVTHCVPVLSRQPTGKLPLHLFDSNCLWDPDSFLLPTHVSAEPHHSALNHVENVVVVFGVFYTLLSQWEFVPIGNSGRFLEGKPAAR